MAFSIDLYITYILMAVLFQQVRVFPAESWQRIEIATSRHHENLYLGGYVFDQLSGGKGSSLVPVIQSSVIGPVRDIAVASGQQGNVRDEVRMRSQPGSENCGPSGMAKDHKLRSVIMLCKLVDHSGHRCNDMGSVGITLIVVMVTCRAFSTVRVPRAGQQDEHQVSFVDVRNPVEKAGEIPGLQQNLWVVSDSGS